MSPKTTFQNVPVDPATPSDRRGERGGVLILALLIAAVFTIIGASLLSSSLTSKRIAANEQAGARALSIAEAGIERARVALGSTSINTLLGAGGNLFTNQALDSGSYSVVVTNNNSMTRFPLGSIPRDATATADSDGYVIVTSTGTLGSAQRKIEVILKRQGTNFSYAVWTNTSANFSSTGSTDSWDSSSGPYTSGGTAGNVFSNGSMTMSGASMINGTAEVGGTIPTAHVLGGAANVTTGVPSQTMTNPTCPASYTPAANITGTSYTYNASTGALSVSGGGNITITGPPYTLFFSSVTLSGNSTMTISAGVNHYDMYVSGTLNLSGGSLANPSAKPTQLTVEACGAGTNNWTLSGGSNAYFAVYAPTRQVTMSGASPLYGAVVADTYTNSGGSAVHYDQALNQGGFATTAGSWAEIYQ